MSTCPITGDATVQNRGGELHWLHADPEIHVDQELIDNLDERGKAFLLAKYELGEQCPYQPHARHARLKEQG